MTLSRRWFAALLLAVMTLPAFGCKKDYTCKCTVNGFTTRTFKVKADTAADADIQCKAGSNANADGEVCALDSTSGLPTSPSLTVR